MKKTLSIILSFILTINIFSFSVFKPIEAQADDYETSLRNQGFPESYIGSLSALHKKYPNWIFKPLKTGLDWQTAVNAERSKHSKQLIEKSSTTNTAMFCNCSSCYKNGVYQPQEGSNWISASEYAVKYYMDPRNWLTEQYIFQFESTSYDGTQTKSGVEAILNGTWMYNSLISYKNASGATVRYDNKTKYSDAVMKAANDSGMSAYYLASKIKQEVGGKTNSAGGASGTHKIYPGIYNYYNIGAYTGAADGLKWASEKGNAAGYFTNTACHIRQKATTSSTSLVVLPQGTNVAVKSTTAKQSDGYTWHYLTANYGGRTYTGYIRSDLVTYKKATAASYNRPWTNPYLSIYNGAKYIANNFKSQNTGYLQKFNVSPASSDKHSHEYMTNVAGAASEARSAYTAYKNANILGVTKTFYIPVYNNMPGNVGQVNGLKYTGYNSVQIRLQWNSVKNANGYVIQKYDGKSWSNVATVNASTLIYTVSNLTPGTKYQFRVRAYIKNNNKTEYGEYSSSCTGYTLPAAVTPTTFSVMNETQINAAWKKGSGNVSGYQIEWARDSAFENIVAKTTVSNANADHYMGSGFEKGVTYYIRVRSYNVIDSKTFYSSWSKTVAAKYIAVSQPTDLKATEITHNSVSLTWSKSANATGYIIQQYKNNSWVNIKTLSTNTNSFTVTNLPSDTPVQFRVKAYHNANGVSNYSDFCSELSVRTEINYTPDQVTGLKYTGYNSTQIRLQWNAVKDATGYTIEKYENGKWLKVTDVDSPTLIYTVSGLTSGTKYQFRVNAYRIAKGKTFIGESSAVCIGYTLPSAITLTTFSVMSETQINAAWQKAAGTATGYQINWAKDANFNTIVKTTTISNPGTTQYKESGFDKNTTYYIRVRSINVIDGKRFYGSWSKTVAAKYIAVTAPSNLRSASQSADSVTLTWNKSSNATGYIIQQYKNNSWVNIKTLSTNTNSYTAAGLSANASNQFRVRAYHNADGVSNYSGWSNTLTIKTEAAKVPARVTGLKYTGYNSTQIRLQWNSASNAAGYTIEKYENGKWSKVTDVNSSTLIYTVSNLTPGTKYQFRVRATANSAYGEYSASCTGYTLPSATTLTTFSVMSETQINAAWQKASGSASGYQIEWSRDANFSNVVAKTTISNQNTTHYLGGGFEKGVTYYIRVRSYNTADGKTFYGSWSKTVAAKYIAVTAPSNIKSTSQSPDSVTLTWSKSSNATGYIIQQYKNNSWINIKTLSTNTNSYTVAGLNAKTAYQFRVKAYHNANGVSNYSTWSNTEKITTK